MKHFLTFSFVLTLLSSCSLGAGKDDTLSFNDPKIYLRQGSLQDFNFDFKPGWYTTNGQSKIDTTTLYQDEFSLLSAPTKGDTARFAQTFYMLDVERIEGDTIVFRGKYRSMSKDSVNIQFGIQQLTAASAPIMETTKLEKQIGESDWQDFSVGVRMDESTKNILFFVFSIGDAQVWTTNWQATIDNQPLKKLIGKENEIDKDTTFNDASNITLPPLNTQMTENLEVLAKVWGFLKYYHPEVVQGRYNWDYELFRVLPQIANAKNGDERSKLLSKWIDKYGKIKKTEVYVIEDSTKYSRIINLDWTKDQTLFDDKLIEKLEQIKNAKRSEKSNHYMLTFLTGKDSGNKENSYQNIQWTDQGYRILSLFRLWNAVEYCFPYVEMTDTPWPTLLQKFIPQFVNSESKLEYELSILKLLAHVDDSHGWINLRNGGDLRKSPFAPSHWNEQIPVTLTKSKEGDVVVSATQKKELLLGDIILKVGDKEINDIIEEKRPYIPTSNEATLARDALTSALTYKGLSADITILRNGQQQNIKIDSRGTNQEQIKRRTPESYDLSSKEIGYIEVNSVDPNKISAILEKNKKGIILDMRIYPNGAVMGILTPLLTPKAETYVWFATNEEQQVGNYKFSSSYQTGHENPDYYKGKVAIIVNEDTQSHGEFSSMAYRKAPRSAIIGSQTAGADGNIGSFALPGGGSITYTCLGTYYPNWELCQREGIKIDIPMRPTSQDIKDGKDALLEKAIEYIME